MSPDVVVHLPSGPVAAYLVPGGVDVSGVFLPRMLDRGAVLAEIPARRGADGGTVATYALVEDYVPGALDIQGGRAAQPGGEHQQRGHEHQRNQKRAQQHGAKVAPRRAGRQSP